MNRAARPIRMVGMAALTVVVPVWDRYVRWLDECVESILAQRAECDLRVLVLDNASTRPLPEQPPEVAVVRTPQRLSVGAARNHALARVETPLVAFVDVDDLFPAGYFAFAVERLTARAGLVAVGMRPVALDDGSGDEREFPWPTDGAIAASRHRRRLALRGLLREPSIVMSGSVFRAAALRRAGGYSDLSYGEDANLALLLPFLGDVELHRSPNRRYRIHPGSLARQPASRGRSSRRTPTPATACHASRRPAVASPATGRQALPRPPHRRPSAAASSGACCRARRRQRRGRVTV